MAVKRSGNLPNPIERELMQHEVQVLAWRSLIVRVPLPDSFLKDHELMQVRLRSADVRVIKKQSWSGDVRQRVGYGRCSTMVVDVPHAVRVHVR
ncbi:hypothetical protein BN381_780014 [Candidatus Microthrix parvicella RN1]|uniref:Uncharacterized protein n=1 Tax=Candidatus Neomicrothrix parvicella RN1 TaxID=1229780 RepID=R4Z454_9ACTN|nr:hypothetical protein BN381_780014 [Candidatus Microthrix parvicella RN1]